MDDEIDRDLIKATQISLGKYIKRPSLTDKLLKKPPFRFLHDIITSVLKSTGFFNGLFEDYELISDKVKDRESKILFLNKVISVVVSTTGKPLTVKPSKIVAGQEPEKTNELLQCLAYALENKLSSDEAVRLYKESNKSYENKPKGSVKKPAEHKKLTSKSSEKLVKNDKPINNSNKTKQKQNHTNKKEIPSKKSSDQTKPINDKIINEEKHDVKSNLVEQLEKPVVPDNIVIDATAPSEAKISLNSDLNTSESSIVKTEVLHNHLNINENLYLNQEIQNEILQIENSQTAENDSKTDNIAIVNNITEQNSVDEPKPLLQDEIDKKLIDKKLIDNNKTINVENEIKVTNNTSNHKSINRPQSVRPSSSRPSAPRLKEKHESIVSSADNLVIGKVNIIAESVTQEEEDDSSIVVVENIETPKNMENNEDILSSKQHGHLVQQILDAQKEFSEVTGKTDIEWQFGAQKSRDIVNQEIEQLRFNVQALSRVANPLGKLLDHVQEDVEVMRQELQQWTSGYEEASKQLIKLKAANEESLLPLHTKLKQLQIDVQEKREKINDLKVIVNKNNFRIEKLLNSGNLQ